MKEQTSAVTVKVIKARRGILLRARPIIAAVLWSSLPIILPLLEERAGVRTSFSTNSPRFPLHYLVASIRLTAPYSYPHKVNPLHFGGAAPLGKSKKCGEIAPA